ncbi:MAG: hypothetical protein CMC13_02425 [Flavobacteriaceae bacterium]|nr:hypothetical protein [Flavobacteriaceae bacterium]
MYGGMTHCTPVLYLKKNVMRIPNIIKCCIVFLFLLPLNAVIAQDKSTLGSTVIIQQIGQQNTLDAAMTSEKGTHLSFQTGNKNKIQIRSRAHNTDALLLQLGANNNILLVHNQPRLQTKTTVFQKGYNQNFLMLGNNRMSDQMIVKMKGKNQNILVRNFRRQR